MGLKPSNIWELKKMHWEGFWRILNKFSNPLFLFIILRKDLLAIIFIPLPSEIFLQNVRE
jgi:hypothetical protein